MRGTKKILLIAAMFLLAISACAAPQPQNEFAAQPVVAVVIPQTEDAVPRISVEDAKAALDSGQAVIVDVRSAEAYAASHAQGAISIPLDEFENNIGNLTLEKDQWIITYCT